MPDLLHMLDTAASSLPLWDTVGNCQGDDDQEQSDDDEETEEDQGQSDRDEDTEYEN